MAGEGLIGREDELSLLLEALGDLKQGIRRLYCILGPRKIGKTSLLEELMSRIAQDPDLLCCRVDLFEASTPTQFFVRLSLGLLDSYLKKSSGGPLLSGLMHDETALTLAAARLRSMGVEALDRAGRSTTLERVLIALSTNCTAVSEIATSTHQQTGAVSTALRQLVEKDLVCRDADGRYSVADPTFAIWVAGNRSSLRTIAGPYYLGSEAERAVCQHLGREGFHLVYRSRDSRGTFDLVALLGTTQIGLQVKRCERFPCYLSRAEHARMLRWGEQLSWTPILVIYDPAADRCRYYDVRSSGRQLSKQVRFDSSQGQGQLLGLI